jgi:hypothetical protein
MVRLLIDTSTLLDLAKWRDGQKWIVSLRAFVRQARLELLVPTVVIEEFKRNRARIEASMTASVSERFRLIKRDLDEYGAGDQQHALDVLEGLTHKVPLIGAMTTRNFEDILSLLESGRSIEPTDQQRSRVVQRGLDKRAPFHRSRNSVADAVLIEIYASAVDAADLWSDPHAFVTSNSDDFSNPQGDKRETHPDLADLFADDGSTYGLGIDGRNTILPDHFGDELGQLFEESDFKEEPRRLDEILEAEHEFFDRVWYHRSLQHEISLEREGGSRGCRRPAACRWAGPTPSRSSVASSRAIGALYRLRARHAELQAIYAAVGPRKRVGFSRRLIARGARALNRAFSELRQPAAVLVG